MRAYRELLHSSHIQLFVLSGILGRLPGAMMPLALLVAIGDQYSLVIAGLVAGVEGVVIVVTTPWQTSMVARWGSRALAAFGIVSVVTLGMMWWWISHREPVWGLFVAAVLFGVSSSPLSSYMRHAWDALLTDPSLRTRAQSFESVVTETVFMAGPLLFAAITAVFGVMWVFPVGMAIEAIGVTGIIMLAPGLRVEENINQPAYRNRNIWIIIVMGIWWCASWALLQVGLTADALERDQEWVVGILMGLLSIGSVGGGLWYGMKSFRWSTRRQLLFGSVWATLWHLPLLFQWLPLSAVTVVILGIANAPLLAMMYLAIGDYGGGLKEYGLYSAATSLGLGIGPMIGGLMSSHSVVLTLAGATAVMALMIPCAMILSEPAESTTET